MAISDFVQLPIETEKSSIDVLSPRLFFKTSPSSFPAVGFFVGIFPFPLFPDGSKTVVLCQGYFSTWS